MVLVIPHWLVYSFLRARPKNEAWSQHYTRRAGHDLFLWVVRHSSTNDEQRLLSYYAIHAQRPATKICLRLCVHLPE